MDDLSKIDPKERFPLEYAWEFYADIVFPIYHYQDELRQLRLQSQQGTRDEAKLVFKKLEHRQDSLKRQFLGFIAEGYFDVFGCDLGANSISSENTKINNSYFDSRVAGFRVNWEENWIEVHNRRIIGIEISPNLKRLRDEFPERFRNRPQRHDEPPSRAVPEPIEVSEQNHRGQPGAKNREEFRQSVLAECHRQFLDFFQWSNNKQIAQANKIAKELFPNQFEGRGLGRTAYLNSRKIYQSNQ